MTTEAEVIERSEDGRKMLEDGGRGHKPRIAAGL